MWIRNILNIWNKLSDMHSWELFLKRESESILSVIHKLRIVAHEETRETSKPSSQPTHEVLKKQFQRSTPTSPPQRLNHVVVVSAVRAVGAIFGGAAETFHAGGEEQRHPRHHLRRLRRARARPLCPGLAGKEI